MSARDSTRILSLQPFYGGSHQQFIDNWISRSSFQWQQLTLPARHWKWRMRHSAVEFSRTVDALWSEGERWDLVICSDMLNLAEFKGMLKTEARNLPAVVYFHENQFEYPNTVDQPRDLHFAFSNVISALAADSVWFNSEFNRDSLLTHLERSLARWPDFPPKHAVDEIQKKSRVLTPGVDVDVRLLPNVKSEHEGIHIVWAARWEHDKNPELLLEILNGLEGQVDFKLSVVGEQFSKWPTVFDEIRVRFADRILNWGFQSSRETYLKILSDGDLFLSTANHEFFGIAAVEAMALGCIPILPNRLSYPELLNAASFPDRSCFLYETVEDAVKKVVKFAIPNRPANFEKLIGEVRRRFEWKVCAEKLDNGIESIVKANHIIQ